MAASDPNSRLKESGWPTGDPRFLALLPIVCVAWSQSDRAAAVVERLAARVEKLDWLVATRRELQARWLNPKQPPKPAELRRLRRVILYLARDLATANPSLASLGIAIARRWSGVKTDYWSRPRVKEALAEMESELGLDGPAACDWLLRRDAAGGTAWQELAAEFDVTALSRVLDGAYGDTRDTVRQLLRGSGFRYEYGLSRPAYQDRVMQWCRELARLGLGALAYPPEYGGSGDLGRMLAVLETLGYHDLSLAVKYGAQFGLFGGSLESLGTRRHHEKYLRAVATLATPGCYAMSEAGHGSNVRALQTRARFDPKTAEFVIDTPRGGARKVFVVNAARHGQLATVFAQLEVGKERHGVHAFLVPLRDEAGYPLPGVRIEDAGDTFGLNGLDTGTLRFDQVRIPRENMLNRYAYVSADGVYATSIPDDSQRFSANLSTLVGGRIGLTAVSLSAAKSGLTIAIRWGARRRQFGRAGAAETRLLDYRLHQRRLMIPLATTYALDLMLKHLLRRYLAHRDELLRDVELRSAALKAYTTWHTVGTLQACREACGGAGYLVVNRFAALRADTDVFTTFEGDNSILMLSVARSLLSKHRKQRDGRSWRDNLEHLGREAARGLAELNPIVIRITDDSHLRDREFQLGALRYRENRYLASLARRVKKRVDNGMEPAEAVDDLQHELMSLARAHVERLVAEQFVEIVAEMPREDLGRQLQLLSDLYALSRLEEDLGWFLESGYIEAKKARAIRRTVTQLCADVRRQALPLVEAFAIPDELLGAPIARKDVAGRSPS